ncbi:MAG: PAS domain S-box protein [Candidatus Bathyarchaeota archaeon]
MVKSKSQYATDFLIDLTEKAPARILHVDDELSLLKVTKQCLEMEDKFQVDTAVSVEEAKNKMKKKAYDVVVSDYMMPCKNGLDFLKELRAKGNTIPFIMFTGKGREEVAVNALNLGADQYINKVGNPETVYSELAHSIRKAIERNRANGKIRKSEEKFRNIFENAGDAMIYLDVKGRILDVNQKTIEIFGGSEKELVGKHFTKIGILSHRDMPKLMNGFAKGLAGKHDIINVNITNRKGKRLSLECHGSLMTTYDETTLLVIARDVTKRKQVEEVLKKTEEKYKALLEETPIGICNLDIKGKITYANKAFEKITGYSRDEILGRSSINLARQWLRLSDKKLKAITDRIKNRLIGRMKSQPITIQLRRKDGVLRWVEAESKLIKRLGMPVGLQAILRDVTESKQIEEKMRESEERFRSIVENSFGGIGIVDNDFKIKYINEQVTNILGYSREEMIGQDFRKFLPENSISMIQDRYIRRQNGEEIPSQYEFEILRKDGEKITVEMKVSLIEISQGKVQTIAEVVDITERKRTYEALVESEEKFRNLAEQLPSMVFINKKGRVVYVNRKCIEVMGYSEEEFFSSDFDFLSLIAPENVDMVTSAFKKHSKGKEVDPYEYTLVTRDGKRIEAIITTKMVKFNGENAILGIVTDITERKNAERELEASREKFHQLFMKNPEAAIYVDSKFHMLEVNPRFTELFGYSSQEVMNKRINDLIVPENRLQEAEALNRNSKKGYVYHSSIRKRKDGTLVPVAISAAPIIYEKRLIGHIALYKDISKLRKTEKALRNTLEKLHVIGGLTRHDVRNKLSQIIGNIYLVRKRFPYKLEVQEPLGNSESAIKQIEEIFDFAEAYEKIGVEELTFIKLEKSVEEAVQLFSDLDEVKILNKCQGLVILADSLLRQLFYNLIDNSLKHGKRVNEIRIHYEKIDDERLKLVYEDNGVGIPSKEKEKIFQEGSGRGTSYGLYLIKKMCEVYGWSIQETGKPGRGAQFTIIIPKTNKEGRECYRPTSI